MTYDTLCPSLPFSYIGSVTAQHSSSGHQPNFVALNRGRHLYSSGRPSRLASADILVAYHFKSTPFYPRYTAIIFLESTNKKKSKKQTDNNCRETYSYVSLNFWYHFWSCIGRRCNKLFQVLEVCYSIGNNTLSGTACTVFSMSSSWAASHCRIDICCCIWLPCLSTCIFSYCPTIWLAQWIPNMALVQGVFRQGLTEAILYGAVLSLNACHHEYEWMTWPDANLFVNLNSAVRQHQK